MPTAGVEYRYPFINVQSWGTQTIEPIAQFVVQPERNQYRRAARTKIRRASSSTPATCSASTSSPAGTASRAADGSTPASSTPPSSIRAAISTSCSDSPIICSARTRSRSASTTNTGLDSGLDKARSDYVARVTYQPNRSSRFTSRFRFDEGNYSTAAVRIRSVVQLRALDDDRHVRQLRAAAGARLPGRARRHHSAPPGSSCRRTGMTFGGVRYDLRGQPAQRDPDRRRLYRRLPHLGRELHYRIPLQYDRRTQSHGDAAVQPADDRRDRRPRQGLAHSSSNRRAVALTDGESLTAIERARCNRGHRTGRRNMAMMLASRSNLPSRSPACASWRC